MPLRSSRRRTTDGARDRGNHFGLLADGRLDGDFKILVAPADLRDEPGKVFLQMAARAQEHQHYPQAADAFAMERRGASRQRGLHQVQEREHDALAWQQLAELGYELLERPRPLRIARAVGEEDECSLDFSFGHDAIMFDAATSR